MRHLPQYAVASWWHTVAVSVIAFGLASSADAEWKVRKWVGGVEVRSEIAFDPRLAAAIDELDPLRRSIEDMFGLTMSDHPIELNIFATRRSYAEHVELRVPGGASRPALFMTGIDRDRVYVAYSRTVEEDIRHECTHAFLHSRLQYVPLWLDEGLAEYFEVPAARRLAGHKHLKALKPRSYLLWRPNIERLEAISELRDMQEAEYRESWAWAHLMVHGPESARDVLREYLTAIAEGGDAGKLEPKLKAAIGDPGRALRSHIRSIR